MKLIKDIALHKHIQLQIKLKSEFKELVSLTLHVDPCKEEGTVIAIPIDKEKGFNSLVSNCFGEDTNFMIVNIENQQIKSWIIKSSPKMRYKRKAE